jgi:hypothetical protein
MEPFDYAPFESPFEHLTIPSQIEGLRGFREGSPQFFPGGEDTPEQIRRQEPTIRSDRLKVVSVLHPFAPSPKSASRLRPDTVSRYF